MSSEEEIKPIGSNHPWADLVVSCAENQRCFFGSVKHQETALVTASQLSSDSVNHEIVEKTRYKSKNLRKKDEKVTKR